jgi:hypothetical protein
MKKIEIPNELAGRITEIRDIKERLAHPGPALYGHRKKLLEELRKLDKPTEAETNLLDELTDKEREVHDYEDEHRRLHEELNGKYERVRQICRDIFRGKYVEYYTGHSIVYMYVTKVTMDEADGGSVYLHGQAVGKPTDKSNKLWWQPDTVYTLFTCGGVMDGALIRAREQFWLTDRTEIVEQLMAFKHEWVDMADTMFNRAGSMGTGELPEDVPVHPEKWR